MIRRSTLVLLTCMASCMATWSASTGAALSTTTISTTTNNTTANATAQDATAQDTTARIKIAQKANAIATQIDRTSDRFGSNIVAQASVRDSSSGATSSGLDITSRGEAVKVLQRRLEAGGYYSGPLDGIYGLATERAVRAFQSEAGLTETGSLNEETWQALQSTTGEIKGDASGEAIAAVNTLSTDTLAQTDDSLGASETAPTASELPATTDVAAVTESDGKLGKVFGISLGLAAVLASFGIGFFLANKDKSNDSEDGEWSEISAETNSPKGAITPIAANGAARSHTRNSDREIAPLTAPITPSRNGQMLAQMGGTSPLTQGDIIDGLIGDLRNPDPARRRKAIWELGQRGNSMAMKPLVDTMVDADSKEKSLVLAALSEIGIRSLKPMSKALAIALQDNNPEVRKNAIRDLTRVYDLVVQISQMLGHATEDEDPEVRQTATWALEQLSRIRRSQDIDTNMRSFTGSANPATPIDLLSSEASLRRSSQQGL